jgi:hypothetical protein
MFALVAGCGGHAHTVTTTRTAGLDASVARALSHRSVARALRDCPVTEANQSVPPGERPPLDQGPSPYYGNGRLWTVLWPRGVFVAGPGDLERDGSISVKFPWWRRGYGYLKITGRRIDARADRLRAHIPRGYGRTGFQSTAVTFPTAGCWRVTGTAGPDRLTVVTLVVRARAE